MFGSNIGNLKWLIITFIFLIGCANPKYLNPYAPHVDDPRNKLESCQVKFSSGNCASLAWEVLPTEETFGTFLFKTFRLNEGDGSPIELDLDGKVQIVLWMPSMGHGSSPVTVERLDIGTYRASNVFFTMKGDWEIRIQLNNENEIKDQAIIPITL